MAPLVVKDLAITGVSGAEYGIRGWLAATDLNGEYSVNSVRAEVEAVDRAILAIWAARSTIWAARSNSTNALHDEPLR